MSGSFTMPFRVTNGANYKAHSSFEKFMPQSIRHASASIREVKDDHRVSDVSEDEKEELFKSSTAVQNEGGDHQRRGSKHAGSQSQRKDCVVGLEVTAGKIFDPTRRISTSLASDLLHKLKDSRAGEGYARIEAE